MTNNERFPFNNIHPTAQIADGVTMGRGNTIGPFCIIGFPAEYKNREHEIGGVRIGDNNRITGAVTIDTGCGGSPTVIMSDCYIMKGAHVGHNAYIGHKVTLACHSIIGGNTMIGDGANIGLGAVIHQNMTISIGCMIGMGAVVTKKLMTEPYKTYVGNPARLLGDNVKHPDYERYTINMNDSL